MRHKLKCTVDSVSICFVVFLLCLVVRWALAPSTTTRLTSISSYLEVSPGDHIYVFNGPLCPEAKQGRVSYTMHLLDQDHKTIYSWPLVVASELPVESDVVIPTEIEKGKYRLVASVSYPKNPFKADSYQLEVAQLGIK